MRFPARRKDTTMTENSFRAEQVILPSPPYKTCWDWAKFMILLLFTWVGKHIEVRTFKGISRNSAKQIHTGLSHTYVMNGYVLPEYCREEKIVCD